MFVRRILLIVFTLPLLAHAQERIWIFFKDKGPQLNKPVAEYAKDNLTQRAVTRRLMRSISPHFDHTDIPVYQAYVDQLRQNGLRIYRKSKWLNGVSVWNENLDLGLLRQFPFVRKISGVGSFRSPGINEYPEPILKKSTSLDYGPSEDQNSMIGITAAHELGLAGQGVRIAMFDTGFRLDHESLQHITVTDAWDFVQNDSIVVNQAGDSQSQHNHGTLVLSVIGGYLPGQLIGPAYQAEYLLAKTEDISSEKHVEEDNWVAAAEWADSLGADIISTSLGYSTFDFGETDYTYEDMNGDSTIITRAADLAARKGILVFSSAGNEGDDSWFYITAPADGDSVIAVGGTQPNGNIWAGSSHGPTFDGRIKPDVLAQGVFVYGAAPTTINSYTRATGTSLACPLAAGAGAILLTLNPGLEPMQIREAFHTTSTRAQNPDNHSGYGLINLQDAMQVLDSDPKVSITSFAAVARPGINIIQWTATVEIKNEAWILRRQVDEMAYEEVVRIPGMPFNLKPQNYTASDPNLHGGETIKYRLSALLDDGAEITLDSAIVTSAAVNSVVLLQSFPNPFNNSTRITFGLNKTEKVSLHIYDIQGRRVATLLDNATKEAQFHHIDWPAPGLIPASGMYYAILSTPSTLKAIKLIFLR